MKTPKPFGLPKHKRVKKDKEFKALLEHGERREGPLFILYSVPDNLPYTRVGVRVSKKVGRAVERNRLKRRLRELFRVHQNLYAPGHDILIIPKAHALNSTHEELRREFLQLLEKEDLLADSDCYHIPQIL